MIALLQLMRAPAVFTAVANILAAHLIATAGAFILGRDLVRKDERISADEFLAQFTILDEPHVDLTKLRREPDPARPPQKTIDRREHPVPPPPNKDDRFIRIESRDDRRS